MILKYHDHEVYSGHLKVKQRSIIEDGSRYVRDVVDVADVIVVMPVFQGMITTVSQYRAPLNRFCTELPAGKIDTGETPRNAAERELAEETNLVSDNWVFLGEFTSSEGYSTERAYLFVALDCRYVESDFVKTDEEASMTINYVDPLTTDVKFNGAKGQLAYELGKQYLVP